MATNAEARSRRRAVSARLNVGSSRSSDFERTSTALESAHVRIHSSTARLNDTPDMADRWLRTCVRNSDNLSSAALRAPLSVPLDRGRKVDVLACQGIYA